MKIELGKVREWSRSAVVGVYDAESREIKGQIIVEIEDKELQEKILNLLKLLEK